MEAKSDTTREEEGQIFGRNVNRLAETVKRLEKGQLGKVDVDDLKTSSAELEALLVDKLQHSVMMTEVEDLPNEVGLENEVVKIDWVKSENSVTVNDQEEDHVEALQPSEINDAGAEHPLSTPEILQTILSKLDKDCIFSCRSVCKNWNANSVDIISKRIPRCCVTLMKDEEENDLDDLPRLSSILRDSENPGMIMPAVFTMGACLAEDECQSLLKEFGWMVKRLKIRDCCIRFSLMKSILEWCPNLEDLRLSNLGAPPHDTVEDYDFKVLEADSVITNQKLWRLSIHEKDECNLNVQFLISIVKMSPNLKCLKNHGFHSSLACKFATELKNLPEITKKFEELKIDDPDWWEVGVDTSLFQIYLDVELSSNLKAVTLKTFESFPNEEISSLLCKLGSHLETITILNRINDDSEDEDEDGASDEDDDKAKEKKQDSYVVEWKTSLPKMPKLRVFKNLVNDTYRLKSIDFLEKMPNLEKLVLAGGKFKPDPPPSDKRGEALFSNSLKRVPHLNLKELILVGKINSDTTTGSISQALPNLSKLYVALGHEYGSDDRPASESQEWFENTFEGLSKMQSLRDLYVDFGAYSWNGDVELVGAFAKLHDLPNLRFLTFVSSSKAIAGSAFVTALKALLSQAYKLQRCTLVKFAMPLTLSTSFSEWLGNRRSTTFVEFSSDDPSYELTHF